MASFVFTGTAFATDEAEVTLTFSAGIVNVNGTAKLVLEGATADSWESSDDAIATVENGVVTGKAIGRVTIAAKSGEEAIASVDIAVVGENLLIRNGVNHGPFESGTASVYTDIEARFDPTYAGNPKFTANHFWWCPTTDGGVRFPNSVTVVNTETALGASEPALKLTYNAVNNYNRWFILRTANKIHADGNYAYGAIYAESGELYELSGWMKYDHTKLRDPYGFYNKCGSIINVGVRLNSYATSMRDSEKTKLSFIEVFFMSHKQKLSIEVSVKTNGDLQ